jgi:hypothetical protein
VILMLIFFNGSHRSAGRTVGHSTAAGETGRIYGYGLRQIADRIRAPCTNFYFSARRHNDRHPGIASGEPDRYAALLDPLSASAFGARDPMLDLLDLLFAGTPYAAAVRDLRYGAANADFSPGDALRPDWTMLRSLLQQPSTGVSPQSTPPWNNPAWLGIQPGLGAIGNYGATLPVGF